MKNSFFESGPPRALSFGEEIRILVFRSINVCEQYHGSRGGVHHHSCPHFLHVTFTGGLPIVSISKWTSSDPHSVQVAWSVAAFKIFVRSGEVLHPLYHNAAHITIPMTPMYTSLQNGLFRSASVRATEHIIIPLHSNQYSCN